MRQALEAWVLLDAPTRRGLTRAMRSSKWLQRALGGVGAAIVAMVVVLPAGGGAVAGAANVTGTV